MYKGEKKTLHNTTAEQDPCKAGKTVKEEQEQTYRYTRLDDDSPLCSVHFLASRSHLELHGHEKHRKKASHALAHTCGRLRRFHGIVSVLHAIVAVAAAIAIDRPLLCRRGYRRHHAPAASGQDEGRRYAALRTPGRAMEA